MFRFPQVFQKLLILIAIFSLLTLALYFVYLTEQKELGGEINYSLTWDTAEAELTDQGWQFENNLGYSITLTEGYVTSYSEQLIACEHTHSFISWLRESFEALLSIAYAGHGEEQDAAAIVSAVREDFRNLKLVELGSVSVIEPTYCKAHYLTASTPPALIAEGDKQAENLSLSLTGSYQVDGEIVAFELNTSQAYGKIHDLTQIDNTVHLVPSSEASSVVFVRTIANLFDGIDLGTQEPTAMAILRNMNQSMRVVVLEGKTHK